MKIIKIISKIFTNLKKKNENLYFIMNILLKL